MLHQALVFREHYELHLACGGLLAAASLLLAVLGELLICLVTMPFIAVALVLRVWLHAMADTKAAQRAAAVGGANGKCVLFYGA